MNQQTLIKSRFFLTIMVVLTVLLACEETVDEDIIRDRVALSPTLETLLNINDIEVTVDSAGRIMMGTLPDEANDTNPVGLLWISGFWVSQESQATSYTNLVWTWGPSSNFTSKWSDGARGIYRIEPQNIDPDTINWPIDEGFPDDGSGNPKLLGDLMLWSALQADSVEGPAFYASPLPDVTYTQTVWAYEQEEYAKTMFLRKTIHNNSDSQIDNVRIAFFSDTDLDDAGSNSTGYDSTRGLTYTYTPSDTGRTYVAGYTFLEVDGVIEPTTLVTSHRIMRKNAYYDPDFGEIGVETTEQILFAMKGLSNDGDSMINPVTSEPSLFAFTGDPVSGSGWLDVQVDVRSLLNGPVLSIPANDYSSSTVVYTIVVGDSLSDALNLLKSKIDEIRSESSLWMFDD